MSQRPEEPTLEGAVMEALARAGICAVDHWRPPDGEGQEGEIFSHKQWAIEPSHAKDGG